MGRDIKKNIRGAFCTIYSMVDGGKMANQSTLLSFTLIAIAESPASLAFSMSFCGRR